MNATMTLTTVRLKATRGWESFDVPATREQIEAWRRQWREWLRANPDELLDLQPPSNGAALSVTGVDRLPINGFDKLILARAIVQPSCRFD